MSMGNCKWNNEISLHTYLMAKMQNTQNNKYWWKGEENPHSLLGEMEFGSPTVEDRSFLSKHYILSKIQQSHSLLSVQMTSTLIALRFTWNPYTNTCRGFIHNWHKSEASKISFKSQINNERYSHTMKYCSLMKRNEVELWKHMEEA